MNLKNFLLVTSVLSLLFGVAFLVAPLWIMGFYGLETNAVGLLFARYFGSSFAMFGLLAWYAKDVTTSSACSRIIRVMFYGGVIGTLLSVYGQTTGLMNSIGWVSVGLFVILTSGLAYYIYIKPESVTSQV